MTIWDRITAAVTLPLLILWWLVLNVAEVISRLFRRK